MMKKIFALMLLSPVFAFASDAAICDAKHPNVDRQSCMLEQRNARAEEKRGRLTNPSTDYAKNRLARCDVFKQEADRKSCVDRVTLGVKSGSVEAGGVITSHKEIIQ